jgi:hypothetical protein
MTPQAVEKTIEVVKEVVGLGKGLADWGQERERTKRAQIEAGVEMARIEKATLEVIVDANAEMRRIEGTHAKHVMDHQATMRRLETEHEKVMSRLRQEERVLDKVLETVDSPAQLAESYRALLLSRNDT